MQLRVASSTAIAAATVRAIHQLVDDEPKILTDPIAVPLLQAAVPGLVDRVMQPELADPDILERTLRTYMPPDRPRSRAGITLRSRFAEDELAVAVSQGVRQYVILGAGLDTFAYRQPPYAAPLEIFEVDHPASQEWKRRSLDLAGIALPPNLHWAPVDFEHQTLGHQLHAAGFDSSRPASFCWLGVTQFLTLAAIDGTLRFIAGLPSPSTLVLTFIPSDDGLTDEQRTRKRTVARLCADLGEPWLTYFRSADLCAHLHDLGFSRVFHLTPEEADARYFGGRRDGMEASRTELLVSATV